MTKFTKLSPTVRFLGLEGRVIETRDAYLRIVNGGFAVARKGKLVPVVPTGDGSTGDANVLAATEMVVGQFKNCTLADLGLAKAKPKAKADGEKKPLSEAQRAALAKGREALAAAKAMPNLTLKASAIEQATALPKAEQIKLLDALIASLKAA